MRVAFRVDAANQIGTGHFMRCMTLADELKRRGAQIRFVSRNLPVYLRDMLFAKEMEFMPLVGASSLTDNLAHARWLGTSQAHDAEDSILALSDVNWDWLVVDHYALDVRWEASLRATARKIMVIDDIADRQHDCDVLLDQNYYADMQTRYTDKVPQHCQLLLGPRYALLREEFRKLREQVKPRSGPVRRILVFFGGVDADNYTGRTIEALSEIDISGLHVDVVIGAQHPCRTEIETRCSAYGYKCHVQTSRMAELMAAADLAIGAGGSASWERCCLGLPALAFCTAENQLRQLENAAQEGLLYAPSIAMGWTDAIKRHTMALFENEQLRKHFSRSALQAVDGRGVLRVTAIIGCGDIDIRTARPDDSESLFQWRNHPCVREVSRNPGIIGWQDHHRWFTSILTDPQKIMLIGQRKEIPVGVVRFDMQGNEAEVSIYLVQDSLSSGMGQNLLKSAEQWLALNHPEISNICAHVMRGNVRSQRLFSGSGYRTEFICYSKRLRRTNNNDC